MASIWIVNRPNGGSAVRAYSPSGVLFGRVARCLSGRNFKPSANVGMNDWTRQPMLGYDTYGSRELLVHCRVLAYITKFFVTLMLLTQTDLIKGRRLPSNGPSLA